MYVDITCTHQIVMLRYSDGAELKHCRVRWISKAYYYIYLVSTHARIIFNNYNNYYYLFSPKNTAEHKIAYTRSLNKSSLPIPRKAEFAIRLVLQVFVYSWVKKLKTTFCYYFTIPFIKYTFLKFKHLNIFIFIQTSTSL